MTTRTGREQDLTIGNSRYIILIYSLTTSQQNFLVDFSFIGGRCLARQHSHIFHRYGSRDNDKKTRVLLRQDSKDNLGTVHTNWI
jgi:hypothetical protein